MLETERALTETEKEMFDHLDKAHAHLSRLVSLIENPRKDHEMFFQINNLRSQILDIRKDLADSC